MTHHTGRPRVAWLSRALVAAGVLASGSGLAAASASAVPGGPAQPAATESLSIAAAPESGTLIEVTTRPGVIEDTLGPQRSQSAWLVDVTSLVDDRLDVQLAATGRDGLFDGAPSPTLTVAGCSNPWVPGEPAPTCPGRLTTLAGPVPVGPDTVSVDLPAIEGAATYRFLVSFPPAAIERPAIGSIDFVVTVTTAGPAPGPPSPVPPDQPDGPGPPNGHGQPTSPSLPWTGFDPTWIVAFGGLLIAGGLALRAVRAPADGHGGRVGTDPGAP